MRSDACKSLPVLHTTLKTSCCSLNIPLNFPICPMYWNLCNLRRDHLGSAKAYSTLNHDWSMTLRPRVCNAAPCALTLRIYNNVATRSLIDAFRPYNNDRATEPHRAMKLKNNQTITHACGQIDQAASVISAHNKKQSTANETEVGGGGSARRGIGGGWRFPTEKRNPQICVILCLLDPCAMSGPFSYCWLYKKHRL